MWRNSGVRTSLGVTWCDSMEFVPAEILIFTRTFDFVFTIQYRPLYNFFFSLVWSLGGMADLAGNYHSGFPEGLSQLQTGGPAR